MREDPIKEAIAKYWNDQEKHPEEKLVKAVPEAHYSYFGKRGVADMYVLWEGAEDNSSKHGIVFEVKSQLREPHKVMRQFNRMVYAFFEDESRETPLSANFELTVAPTEENLKHLVDYMNLYRSLGHFEREQFPIDSDADKELTKYLAVTFRHSDNVTPVYWGNISNLIMKGNKNWQKTVKNRNKEVADSLGIL